MPAPTQQFVPIQEIRDGIVVLKDGSLRAIVMASSQNLALKSEEEQRAILFSFQDFLNMLDFSTQFFVQSRKLDMRPYIALLEDRRKKQQTDLMRIQVTEYVEFIRSFTESINIMTKSFFVVVPYSPALLGGGAQSILARIVPWMGKKTEGEDAANSFEEHRTQLEQRIAVVQQGLSGTGIRVARLGTEELVEMYYSLFNPEELEKPFAESQINK